MCYNKFEGSDFMKVKGKNSIGSLLKVFLQICMVIGTLILVFLYSILKAYNLHFDLFSVMIYPCGILFLALIYQFVGLFNSLKESNPFCNDNVIKLNRGMVISFIISALIVIALCFSIFLYNDYYTFSFNVCVSFICILFFGVGIALYVLKELFKEAISYKEENELTI